MTFRCNHYLPREASWDLIFGLILIVTGGWLLHAAYERDFASSSTFWPDAPGNVGELRREEGWVRYRTGNSLFWREMGGDSQKVFDGDRVFTGDDGTALYTWKDGSARIFPRSLVQIRAERSRQEWELQSLPLFLLRTEPALGHLEVKSGEVFVHLDAGARPVQLEALGKPLRLSASQLPAALQIAVDGEGADRTLRITTRSGGGVRLEAADLSGSLSTSIATDETAVLRVGRAVQLSPSLLQALEPKSFASVVQPVVMAGGRAGEKIPVNFRWRREKGVPMGGAALEFSREASVREGRILPAFTQIEKSGASDSLTVSLEEGDYRWRLLLPQEKAPSWLGPWQWLKVTALRSPEAMGPADGARLAVGKSGKQEVRLRWKLLDPGVHGEVELLGEGLSAGQRLLAGNQEGLDLELSTGTYSWRIRAAVQGGRQSNWGPMAHFHVGGADVKVAEPFVAPVPLPSLAPAPVPSLAPAPAPSRVGRRPRPSPLARPIPSPKPSSAAIPKPRPSPVVVPAMPVTKEPADGASFHLQETVVFSWPVDKAADSYRVQIALTPGFAAPLVDRTVRTNYLLYLPQSTVKYFWRMKTVSKNRQGEWSKTRQLEVKTP